MASRQRIGDFLQALGGSGQIQQPFLPLRWPTSTHLQTPRSSVISNSRTEQPGDRLGGAGEINTCCTFLRHGKPILSRVTDGRTGKERSVHGSSQKESAQSTFVRPQFFIFKESTPLHLHVGLRFLVSFQHRELRRNPKPQPGTVGFHDYTGCTTHAPGERGKVTYLPGPINGDGSGWMALLLTSSSLRHLEKYRCTAPPPKILRWSAGGGRCPFYLFN